MVYDGLCMFFYRDKIYFLGRFLILERSLMNLACLRYGLNHQLQIWCFLSHLRLLSLLLPRIQQLALILVYCEMVSYVRFKQIQKESLTVESVGFKHNLQ